MIRSAIIAALVMSPLMVHAQAITSAQPAGLMLGAAEDRSAAKPGTVRVSTGVVAPKLIKTVSIQEDTVSALAPAAIDHNVVVAMIVDEKGKPEDLKIVQSAGAELDRNVLSAVSSFRFQPGTVSGLAVAFPVNLKIDIQSAAK
jgi:TonB family protein